MKRLIPLFAGLITVVFVITSCDIIAFEPSGENFVEINQNPKAVSVNWTSIEDTLIAWSDVRLYVSNNMSESPIYLFGLVVNGVVVDETEPGNYLTFDSTTLQDGMYPMQLVALTRSATGSLLDKLGGEFQLVSSNPKVMHIDNAPVGSVDITQLTLNEDGTLTIEWEPYGPPRIASYSVHDITNCTNLPHHCPGQTDIPVGTTSWTDDQYNGDEREYVVIIHDPRAPAHPAAGNPRKFTEGPLPTQFNEIIDDGAGNIQLNWNRTRYPRAFNHYHLALHFPEGYSVSLAKLYEENQTQFDYHMPVGTKGFITISTVTTRDDHENITVSDSIFVEYGRSFTAENKPVHFVRYLPEHHHYLILEEGNLMLLDGSTLRVTHHVPVFSGANVHFNLAYDLKSFVIVQGGQVRLYSTENLGVIDDFLMNPYVQIFSNIQITHPIIDRRNHLWFNLGTNHGSKVLTLQSKQVTNFYRYPHSGSHFISDVHPFEQRILGRLPGISGSGTMNQYVYYDGPSIIIAKNYDTEYSMEAHFSRDGEIIYVTNATSKIWVTDYRTYNDIRSFDLPYVDDVFKLDVLQNVFYYRNFDDGTFTVRSLDDGSVVHQYSLNQFHLYPYPRFEHEIVWFNNGMYQFINELY